jgi:hypothetical protein
MEYATVGKLVFGIFAALSEFECELISEWTGAGAPFKMTMATALLSLVPQSQAARAYRNMPSSLLPFRSFLARSYFHVFAWECLQTSFPGSS